MKSKWTSALIAAMFSSAFIIAGAASAAGWSGGTKGQDNMQGTTGYQHTSKMDFSELDTNHDGTISKEEAAANPKLYQDFKNLDKNGDGKLEKAEFARFETMEHGKSMEPGGKTMEHGKTTEPGQSKTW